MSLAPWQTTGNYERATPAAKAHIDRCGEAHVEYCAAVAPSWQAYEAAQREAWAKYEQAVRDSEVRMMDETRRSPAVPAPLTPREP